MLLFSPVFFLLSQARAAPKRHFYLEDILLSVNDKMWSFLVSDDFIFCRDCIGDSSLAGDQRWAGTFGVNLDFVARSHCSIEFISIDDIKVCCKCDSGGIQ